MHSVRSLLLGLVFLAHKVTAVDRLVDLTYSKYAGTPLSNGLTQWLGIPYAAPPIGDLRFAPPADPPTVSGIQEANKQGPICIGFEANKIPNGQSEDCLYLAVYAPSSATTKSNLPVFVFIQGGGFNFNANPNINATGLIEASGRNIIVVTFNYRVGAWGFLSSSTFSSGSASTNNGLRDQRKLFEWIQKHISAFGGNPNHVVLGGDSAGAASISLHLTAYGGRNDKLFHAAAAESVSFGTMLTINEAEYQYVHLLNATGCLDSDSTTSLACLKSKTAAELQAHSSNVPYPGQKTPPLYMWHPVIDGDFIADQAYVAFQKSKFINIPVIIGDDTNGGTLFAPQSISSQQQSDEFLITQFPFLTQSQISRLNELYPNPDQHTCPASGCWWRQASNAYGEMRYMCPGLYISSIYANTSTSSQSKSKEFSVNPVTFFVGGSSVGARMDHSPEARSQDAKLVSDAVNLVGGKSYAYRYNVEDPTQMAHGLGVPHTVEVSAIFGPEFSSHAPASYFPGKSNAGVVPVIQAYWTSFIRTFDPNTHRAKGAATWEEYYDKDKTPQRLLFNSSGKTSMEILDSGLKERCAYLWDIGPSLRQK